MFDIQAYIVKEFARRISTKEEEAFFVGDGAGKPVGIFNAAGGGEVGVTTTTANITFDDVMDVFYSLKAPYRKKAKWILNDSTVKAFRKLKDANGNYIWQPSVSAGVPDMILNRPYYTSTFAPEVASGATPLAFGDFSYYWIADREGRRKRNPLAYDHFAEGESPDAPFVVYLYPKANHFAADGKVYFKSSQLNIELYTAIKDVELEEKVEAVLDSHSIFYAKSEVWIESEHLYEVLYVVIDLRVL